MPVHVPTVDEVKAEYMRVLNLLEKTPHLETEYLRVRGSADLEAAYADGFYHHVANSPSGTVLRYTGNVFIEKHRDSQMVTIRRRLEEVRRFLEGAANGRSATYYLDFEKAEGEIDGINWIFVIRGIIRA